MLFYKKYVEKYPTDAEGENFSASAKAMIDILEGKTNIEELIKKGDNNKPEGTTENNAKQEQQVPPKKQNTQEIQPQDPNTDKPQSK